MNATPPAPPPIASKPDGQNDYDFIFNPPKPPKKKLLSSDSSKTQRIILIVFGAVILITLISVFMSILGRAGSATKQEWIKLAQQQMELVRISGIGIQKAQGVPAKNLAITTKLTVESSQADIQALAKKAGAKLDKKELAGSINAQTDSKFLQAQQANQFDTVFIETVKQHLKDYQQQLKKLHDISSPKTQTTLSPIYNSVGVLLSEGK